MAAIRNLRSSASTIEPGKTPFVFLARSALRGAWSFVKSSATSRRNLRKGPSIWPSLAPESASSSTLRKTSSGSGCSRPTTAWISGLFTWLGTRADFLRRSSAAQADLNAVMAQWRKENEEFRNFIAVSGLSSVTAGYDLLAQSPETEFRRLFEFCGMIFTKECLSYWNVEHHGFAANGASDAILKGKGYNCMPGHFRTGDIDFYKEKSQTLFHDLRWRAALAPANRQRPRTTPRSRDCSRASGSHLPKKGIKRCWTRNRRSR